MFSKFAQTKWLWGVLGLALVLAAAVFGVMALSGSDRAQADTDPAGCTGGGIQQTLGSSLSVGHVGDTITYTVLVSNTHPLPVIACKITNIVVQLTTPDGVVHAIPAATTLNPGDVSGPFTVNYVIRAIDVSLAGSVRASLISTGKLWNTPLGFEPSNTRDTDEAETIVINPSTILTKTASATTVLPGTPVTYTYRERNDGDVPLTGVSVVDDKCSPLARQPDAPGNNNNTLDVGETWVFTCTAVVNAPTTNTAIGHGLDPTGLDITYPLDPQERAQVTVRVINPSTILTKTASPTSGTAPLAVTYTYTEKNTGDVPITGVALTDDKCAPVARGADAPGNNDNILDVGETWVFTCSVTLTQTTTNVVTATGKDPLGGDVPERATATVTVIHPETTLTKTASPTSGTAPLAVTYTYREKNTGDDPITGVALTDDKCAPVARGADDPGNNDNILDVGETWVFTCSTTLNETTTNVVTATGTDSLGGAVPERATATVVVTPPAVGRMTGGGSVFKIDGARVTRGFEIHCDLREPNNIEVNWPGGNNFHMTSLTAAVCTEDPAIIQKPPAAPFDTFTGEGTGKLNGETGATIHFVFVDAGEPGKSDTALIQIWDAAGNLVLEVSGFIDVGNLQAHKD